MIKMAESLENITINDQETRNVLGFGGGEIGKIKQHLLYKSRVMVVGSGPLSQMVLVNLAGLGVGIKDKDNVGISIVDNARIKSSDRNEFLCFYHSGKKILELENTLKKINQSLNITLIYSKFLKGFTYKIRPKILIDATNNSISKERCLSYAVNENIPFISLSSTLNKGVIASHYQDKNDNSRALGKDIELESIVHSEFESSSQGNVTSGVIAGLAAEEVVKRIFSALDKDSYRPLENGQRIYYNLNSKTRTNSENDFRQSNRNYYRNCNVLVVGCGALGNAVALFASLRGFGNIDFIDFDETERNNISRGVLLYDGVGKYKAETLSQRVKEINRCNSTPYVKRFTEEDEKLIAEGNSKGKYDLVFSCVDRYKPRYILNEFCVKYSVPLINGGTSVFNGNVELYMPRETYCVGCQTNLKQKALEEDPDVDQSCGRRTDPSIIMPNFIIGAAMVAESLNILDFKLDNLLRGKFHFTTERNRLYKDDRIVKGRGNHGCYNPLKSSKSRKA